MVGHLKVHAILSQRPFTQYCMNLKMAGHFAHGVARQPPHPNIVCSIARARNEEGRKKTWISRSSSADKKEVKERDLRKKVEFGQRAPVDGISGP